ncbi:MAG: MarR family transcriptional regulator [Lachnospiraceae bacterium]|nr:MarR family transcriptional regulator [Lachnospiraceae bacterium]
MKKYLAEIFGLSVKIENWDGKSKLPLYLRNKREYFVLSMGNVQSVLMKNNSDNFNVSGFEKEMQEIEKYAEMSVILWLDAVSTYQRNALVKSRIPFIVPNSQIFVPELGMSLKEFCAGKREKVEKISAATQFLLLYFIYQKKHEEKSQSEIAEYLNMSAMNVSRAVQELQELGLLESRKEGTSKVIKSVATGKELYQLSSGYLQSPVQKRIYVSLKYFDMDLPFAGETALAKRSMLNYPKCTVFAMDKKLVKDIPQEAIVEPKLMADNDYIEIELWKYNPSVYTSDEMVDIVSLVQSLKDVEDERVEMQIEEIMEEYKW